MSCSQKESTATGENPFYTEWQTPFGVPPFSEIADEHYMPAFKKGMEEHLREIEGIAQNEEAPTFANTIEAMERSGKLLNKVSYVFYNLVSANTNDAKQAIQKEISPLLSKHSDDIYLNADLFERVKTLYDNQKDLALTREQERLLEDYYKGFVRAGANLSEADKEKMRAINEELSVLSVQFGENVLKEDNGFELVIDNEEDLAGLPQNVRNAGAEAAKAKGYDGKWLFTLHKPSLIPFIQYSERRDLREKLYKGYINRGDNNNEFDNKEIVNKVTNLRVRKAQLLGYDTHADFVLEERMAKNSENVYELLDKIWPAALAMAKKERDMMQDMIDAEGGDFKLASWDWWYYAEKIRKQKYSLDEDEIRAYLKIDNVINGSFVLAAKLFGLTFEERDDIPKYHPEVKTYVVKDENGETIGVYLSDWFYRESKRGGAWMNSYRKQQRMDGEVLPIIVNVGNFTKPTADTPSLLSLDEANTLFHEFGHALHGLLSDCTYPSISGTDVPRDFVEFPSQVLENWVLEPEMLKLYAFHYETGDVMPQELIDKIKAANQFNQGFATVEYLAASYLDMAWHTLNEEKQRDVNAFEKAALDEIGLIPEIISRYRSTYFRHIIGGYSSGYYSYIWSEVMDADAFEAFKESGIFDQKTAKAYRDNILAKGGTEDAMTMYVNFRGQEPQIEPLLKRRGLN